MLPDLNCSPPSGEEEADVNMVQEEEVADVQEETLNVQEEATGTTYTYSLYRSTSAFSCAPDVGICIGILLLVL